MRTRYNHFNPKKSSTLTQKGKVEPSEVTVLLQTGMETPSHPGQVPEKKPKRPQNRPENRFQNRYENRSHNQSNQR